jgi:hypothetical protein
MATLAEPQHHLAAMLRRVQGLMQQNLPRG